MKRNYGFNIGATLIELMVAVAIVGILAAIAIPILSDYVKESRMSEVVTNIQGILESEQAYFLRLQRYSGPLPICPPSPPGQAGSTQLWVVGDCDSGWAELGWNPDGPICFQYQVFSLYNASGERTTLPASLPDPTLWGVDWSFEFSNDLNTIQPWCAVQAVADTDGDGKQVFFRGNSYNQKIYRSPNPDTEEATY